MSRSVIGFLIGAAITVVGVLLALNASSLATHWQSIGPDAWGGTTNPGTEQTYRVLGIVAAAFGCIVLALSLHYWLREPDRRVLS